MHSQLGRNQGERGEREGLFCTCVGYCSGSPGMRIEDLFHDGAIHRNLRFFRVAWVLA